MKDAWGCEKRTRMSQPTFVEEKANGDKIKYWNCPRRFIANNIIDFLQEYNYIMNFNVPMPLFKNLNPKFLKAMEIYANELNIARKEIMKNG